jgi:hypothetical protein
VDFHGCATAEKNSMQLQWIQKVGVGGLEKKENGKTTVNFLSVFVSFFLR